MPSITQSIATIRACLNLPDLTLDDRLREAASVYAEACRQLDERLARCEKLLRQGLRAEALRQAEIEPDVLDTAAELDFEGRDQWEERLMLNNVPNPPAINRKAVEMLNSAYKENAPLVELQKHQHLLALGRAPLCERVQAVRLLAKAEPTNPAWGGDLASFEAARIEEIRVDLRHVRQANDWPRIAALKMDMDSSEWRSSLPLDLVDEVGQEHRRVSRLDAEIQLKKYLEMANRANEALDLNRCRGIRGLIDKLCRERQIEPGDALMKSLVPFLDWLAEQDRLARLFKQFDRACVELKDAIIHGADWDLVLRLYESACSILKTIPKDSGKTIPKDLENSYRDRKLQHKRKQQRTLVFFIVAMLLMFGLMVGVLGLVLIFA